MKIQFAAFIMKIFPNFYFSKFWTIFFVSHMKPVIYADQWSMHPFNGQITRYGKIRQIASDFKPTTCIETGTYFGSSTPYLADLVSGETYTIEVDETNYKKALERFQTNYPMYPIHLIHGDSASELPRVLDLLNSETERLLVYLDAHWLEAIPTKLEIQHLLAWGGEWVGVIDDFQVPADPGYGYDLYGQTIIGVSQVPRDSNLCVYVPKTDSKLESGARRGTGYVFPQAIQKRLNEDIFFDLQLLEWK